MDRLGQAQFGVWALAGAVLGTIRLVDLGLNRALTYRVATALGQARPDAARAALGTGRSLAIGLGALAFAAVALLARPLVERVLAIPPALQTEALIVIVGTALVAAVEGVFAPYQAALDGAGRLDVSNAVDTLLQRILSPLGVVLVLGLGWGLAGLVAKNLVTTLAAGVAYAWLLGRHAPALAGSQPRLDRAETSVLLAFGRHVQTVSLASALVEPVTKTLVTRAVGLEALALYELAVRVTGQLGGVFMALSTALFPAAAHLIAAADSHDDRSQTSDGLAVDQGLPGEPLAALVTLYHQAARYNAWAVLPAYGLFLALADPFVAAWLGPDYAPLAPALVVLGVGWCVALLALPAFLVAQAGGMPRLSTTGGLVTAAVSLGTAAVLVRPAGLSGVVAGLALGLAAGGVVTLALFARGFGIGWSVLAVAGWRVLLAALIGAGLARLAAGSLPATLPGLCLAALAGLLAAAGLMLASGEVGVADRALIRRLVGGARDGGGQDGGGHDGGGRRSEDGTTEGGVTEGGAMVAQPAPRSSDPGALPLRITAVIPTWNGRGRLAESLDGLAGQVDCVVVVDNGSTDGTAAWLAGRTGDPEVVAIHNPDNRGFPAAANQGIARALADGAEAVLLVNDDAIFEAGAVGVLAAVLWEDASAGAVSAKMVYRDRPDRLNGTGGIVDLGRGWAWLRGAGELDRGQYDAVELADYPNGAASLLRRAAIEAVGGFDEAYYLYYEDVDWGLRAYRLGWRTRFAPTGRVHHGGSAATASDPARRRYYNVRNRLRFARLHTRPGGRAWAWLATLGLLAKQAVRWFSRTRRRDAEAVAWGVVDHLRGRYGRSGRFG